MRVYSRDFIMANLLIFDFLLFNTVERSLSKGGVVKNNRFAFFCNALVSGCKMQIESSIFKVVYIELQNKTLWFSSGV